MLISLLLLLKQPPCSQSPRSLNRFKRLNPPSPRSSQRSLQSLDPSRQRSRRGLSRMKERPLRQRRAKRTRKLVKTLKRFSLTASFRASSERRAFRG